MKIVEKLSPHKVLIECSVCGNHEVKDYYTAIKSNTGDQCKKCSNALRYTNYDDREAIKKILNYDRETGLLTLTRNQRTKLKGDVVGQKHGEGYLSVVLNNKAVLVHRLIWFMETGEYPIQIDHINHIRDDNRWVNLREIIPRENQLNMSKRTSALGIQGVRQLKSGKFNAYIMVNRKQINLGAYVDLNDAINARKEAEIFYGFHPNHGR
ncbi:hypothetical protein HWA94_gp71 [Pseudomonas phage ZC08]|uniref:HNH nuclease domain-containing protein n=1 Tax=Pseudomonas phage ZC08 TaxID=1622116 RepID=A0A1L2C9C5_9CAUD|nr:hypothetical protein HWA94_gp71 [Pseudomonas phage ZC08]AMD43510.1 hypothetical protein ZC08_055 [Pseudomonas phage ZC08]